MPLTPRYDKWIPNFEKLNNDFSRLQNVELTLRDEGGDFSDITRITIQKRRGTAYEGQEISATDRIHSQHFFKAAGIPYHLAYSDTDMYKKITATISDAISTNSTTINVDSTSGFDSSGTASINGDRFSYTGTTATSFTGVTGISVSHSSDDIVEQWDSIYSSLQSDEEIGGETISSYGGTEVIADQDVDEEFSGSWTSEHSYDSTAGTTSFTDSSGGFPTDDSLIGWLVYPNQTDTAYRGNAYEIISHTSTVIIVSGEVSGTVNSKDYKIIPPSESTILLDLSQSWTQDQYKGFWVVITAGKGLGQARRISANETNYLSIGIPWDIIPDSTSDYSVYDDDNDDNVFYFSNKTDGLHKFDGTNIEQLTGRPKGNIVGAYKDRLFVSGDDDNPFTIYYSQIGNPEFFDATFLIRPKGSDEITGFTTWNQKGIIFKKRSVWAFEFVYNEVTQVYDVSLEKIPSATGCITARAFTNIDDGEIWYYDGKEVSALGASPNQIGVLRTKSISFPVNAILETVTIEQAESAVMENDGKIVRLSIPDADIFLEFNLEYNTWTTRTGNTASSLMIDTDGVWFYGDKDTGNVYAMDVLNHFADGGVPGLIPSGGTAIDTKIGTRELDFGSRTTYKNYRFIDFIFDNDTSSFVYTIEIQTAKHKLIYSKEKAIGFNTESDGSQLATSEFGETTYGGANPVLNTFQWRVSIGRDPGLFAIIEARNNVVDETFKLIGLECIWKSRQFRHFPNQFIT